MSDDVSVGCLSMSSCRCHVPVESLEIVTLGAVQAVAEDVADGVGLGVLDAGGRQSRWVVEAGAV